MYFWDEIEFLRCDMLSATLLPHDLFVTPEIMRFGNMVRESFILFVREIHCACVFMTHTTSSSGKPFLLSTAQYITESMLLTSILPDRNKNIFYLRGLIFQPLAPAVSPQNRIPPPYRRTTNHAPRLPHPALAPPYSAPAAQPTFLCGADILTAYLCIRTVRRTQLSSCTPYTCAQPIIQTHTHVPAYPTNYTQVRMVRPLDQSRPFVPTVV